MITGKNLMSDCELRINTNGIQFKPFTIAEDLTIKDDAVDAMSNYVINDLKYTRIAIDDLRKSDLYIKGIWNIEGENSMNLDVILKNDLLRIYYENAIKDIKEREQKELEENSELNDKVKIFNDYLKAVEQTLDELYESEDNVVDGVNVIEKNGCNCMIWKYRINTEYTAKISLNIKSKYDKERKELEKLCREVSAHLRIVEETDNSYNAILAVLSTYNIVDDDFKVKCYYENKCDETCSCKRGRKPKKEQE